MATKGERYRPAFPPNPKPYISTGLPFHKACAHHITNTFQASKIYLIVSSSISKTENFSLLQSEIGDKIAAIRYGIKPHTPWTDVLEIVNDIKEKGADLIVTLGAGSLTDGAKVISFVCPPLKNSTYSHQTLITLQALANKAFTPDELAKLAADVKKSNLLPCELPVINIPTSLSGGEYSPFAGATDMRTHQKSSFAHPSMGADLIILDPALSVSTPERIWLSTGMRAVDHCVEGLCSLSPAVGQASDHANKKGLRLLVPNLLRTRKDWGNLDARLNEMMGVLEAMKGGT
jgi:alcohol dehydrogenase class IV